MLAAASGNAEVEIKVQHIMGLNLLARVAVKDDNLKLRNVASGSCKCAGKDEGRLVSARELHQCPSCGESESG